MSVKQIIISLNHIMKPQCMSNHFMFMSDITLRDKCRGAAVLFVPLHCTGLHDIYFAITSGRLRSSLSDNTKL